MQYLAYMTPVNIRWLWSHIDVEDSARDIEDRFIAQGLTLSDLERSVYVIRTSGIFSFNYPKGTSPALYIGQGRFGLRIYKHFKWIDHLIGFTKQLPVEVAVATPRVRNNLYAHRELEAFLLKEFYEQFGSLPFRNRKKETTRYSHLYNHNVASQVFGHGSGKRYYWSLQPLKGNTLNKRA